MLFFISFLSGVFLGNGIPHFVKGITKESYPCLFGNTPVPNLIAGWGMMTFSVWLFNFYQLNLSSTITITGVASGVFLIGIFHAYIGAFGKKSK